MFTPFPGIYLFFIFKIFIFTYFEREKEGGRDGNINVWLPLMRPLLGTWPATQACALTGNRTGDPLICRSAINPLSYSNQGQHVILILFHILYFTLYYDNLVIVCS